MFLTKYGSLIDLTQTCQRLRAVTSTDYIWHEILPRDELPLSLPAHRSIRDCTGRELQESALRALRLRTNWARKLPVIQGKHCVASSSLPSWSDTKNQGHLKLVHDGTLLVCSKDLYVDLNTNSIVYSFEAFGIVEGEAPRPLINIILNGWLTDFDACVVEDGACLILAVLFMGFPGEYVAINVDVLSVLFALVLTMYSVS